MSTGMELRDEGVEAVIAADLTKDTASNLWDELRDGFLYIERNVIAKTRAKYNVQSKADPIAEFLRKDDELYDLLTGN